MAYPSLDLESGPDESFDTPPPTAQVQLQVFPKASNRYLRGPLAKRASASTYSSTSHHAASVPERWESGFYRHPDITYSSIKIPSHDTTEGELPGLAPQSELARPEPATSSGDRLLTVGLPQEHSNIQTGDHIADSLSTASREHEIFSLIAQVLSFGLSGIYRTRVNRLFLEANLSLGDIKEMVCHTTEDPAQREHFYHLHETADHPKLPRFQKLLDSWDSFVETTVREWKNLNVASALLLTAILTVLQIPDFGDYRPIRYTALVALMCALMSIIFGVAFAIQFSSMRRKYIAAEWALEVQKLRFPFSDIRHLLALPAVWLTWSLMIFVIVIQMCIWRENMGDDQAPLLKHLVKADKIISTLLLVAGLIYFLKVTLCFLNWGQDVEENWKILIDQYYKESEVQRRQASSLSDIRTTPKKTRGLPQLGMLLTPPHSGSSTPQVTVQPATPGCRTLRCPPLALGGNQILGYTSTSPSFQELTSPNTLGISKSPEIDPPQEDDKNSAIDTTTPLSPLPVAGGLIDEYDDAQINSVMKAVVSRNGHFKDQPSRSSSVDTHQYKFGYELENLDSGSGAGLSQPRVRKHHTTKLTPNSSNETGARLTPTRT